MTTLGNWTIPIFKNDKSSYIFYKLIIFHSKLFNNQREYPQALNMLEGELSLFLLSTNQLLQWFFQRLGATSMVPLTYQLFEHI